MKRYNIFYYYLFKKKPLLNNSNIYLAVLYYIRKVILHRDCPTVVLLFKQRPYLWSSQIKIQRFLIFSYFIKISFSDYRVSKIYCNFFTIKGERGDICPHHAMWRSSGLLHLSLRFLCCTYFEIFAKVVAIYFNPL